MHTSKISSHATPVEAYSDTALAPDVDSINIKIKGLRFVQTLDGEDLFQLRGIKRRAIDMRAAMVALGITEEELESNSQSIDQLGEDLHQVVMQHDIVNFLKSRVKFVG